MTPVLVLLLLQSLAQTGAQAMREGRFAEAEHAFRELLKKDPANPQLHMNLGLALHSEGKYAEAIPHFEAFLKADQQPGPAHLLVGVARLKLRQPCEAIAPLEKARAWQASAQVLIELGDAYFGCRRYADAARTFESLGPVPKALQGAGLSYARLGRQQEAQRAFALLETQPPSPELHELLSEVRTLEKRYDDALSELDQAIRLAPRDQRLKRLHARALWRAGKYEAAAAEYKDLAPRSQDDPEFLFEYGDTLVRTEGPEAGLPLLEKAVRGAPQILAARGAFGRALVQAGRAAEAVPHLEAAAGQDPTLLLPLSRAYKANGRDADAARAEAEYKRRVAQPEPQN